MTSMYSLNWDKFGENLVTNFATLRQEEHFSDVTLLSDDEVSFTAHKLVLAGSSPFFQNILKKNAHLHPILYLHGVNSEFLTKILEFIYEGKVQIRHEDLDLFLLTAEQLSVKGLSTKVIPSNDNISIQDSTKEASTGGEDFSQNRIERFQESADVKKNITELEDFWKLDTQGKNFSNLNSEESKERKQSPTRNSEKVNEHCGEQKESTMNTFINDQDNETIINKFEPSVKEEQSSLRDIQPSITRRWEKIPISDMSQVAAKIEELSEKINGIWTCKWCGKTTTAYHRKSLGYHIESHMEGLSYPCSQCSKVFSTRNSLSTHLHNHKLETENRKRWEAAGLTY